MGLFKKKKKKEDFTKIPSLPELPELPRLPEFPGEKTNKDIHQLPRFPNNSLGDKFSQDTIKEAVTGKKEDEGDYANDFGSLAEEQEMMQKSLKIETPEEINIKTPIMGNKNKEQTKISGQAEPIFVRLDKFEESQNLLEHVKKEISDINKLLEKTKEIKNQEDDELKSWETELQNIKTNIEKIDKSLFSKL